MSDARCQVPGVRCQALGVQCQVPGVTTTTMTNTSEFRNARIGTGNWPLSLELQLRSTNNKTPTTKEQCRHGGGPTRQRSWILVCMENLLGLCLSIQLFVMFLSSGVRFCSFLFQQEMPRVPHLWGSVLGVFSFPKMLDPWGQPWGPLKAEGRPL